jgi:hypothetical protein
MNLKKKKMKNKFYNIFSGNFACGQYLRLKENEVLQLYLGKDNKGRFSLEFRGQYTPTKLIGSEVISVTQLKSENTMTLLFSLENSDLLEYFCTFCEDIVGSVVDIHDDNIAYKTLCSRYLSWKKLFKPNHGKLNEFEVMGLIGELLYLRDNLFPIYGFECSLESWTGPEYAHKDFSLNDKWHEIKTISVGKGIVRISSLEQLDSDDEGVLAIYELEKMSPSYSGIKLNGLVTKILAILPSNELKEIFLSKLSLFGYDFSTDYDNFVFALQNFRKYAVSENFPRLTRANIPKAIQRIQYDLILAEIENFKI